MEVAARKRGFEELAPAESTLSPAEFDARVKRQRTEIYEGVVDHAAEYKAGLVFQLGAWLCQVHGFQLAHPVTQQRELCFCPASSFPYDMAADPIASGCADGMPQFKIGSLCATREESAILAEAVGAQQWALYLGLILGASLRMPVEDAAAALACRFCDKTCSSADTYLLTVAEEYGATCCHPSIAGEEVIWASDDRAEGHCLYGSRADPARRGAREGAAVCLRCLYAHVLAHDPLLGADLRTWFTFDVACMKNLLSPTFTDARRLCACQHPTLQGAMCLFRFSRVLPAAHAVRVMSVSTQVNIAAMISGMLEAPAAKYAFDASDPVLLDVVKHGHRFTARDAGEIALSSSDPTAFSAPVAPRTDRDASGWATTLPVMHRAMVEQFAVVNGRFNELIESATRVGAPPPPVQQGLRALAQEMHPLDWAAPAAAAIAAPTAEAQSHMSAEEHLAFMARTLPVVQAYYRAANYASAQHANKIVVSHDAPTRMPAFCHACGCYGHPQTKTCPFTTTKKTTPRNNGTRADHFAANVKTFVDANRDALQGIIGKSEYEAAALYEQTRLTTARLGASGQARRGGPAPDFVGTAPHRDGGGGGRARRSPIPMMTPSIAFETLASVPRDLYASVLDFELFTTTEYYAAAIGHWTRYQFAAGDMADLLAWLTEVKLVCPADQDFAALAVHNAEVILSSLYAFVQRRRRLVQERGLVGDEAPLADAMRAAGTLTGWALPPAAAAAAARTYTAAELLFNAPLGAAAPADPQPRRSPAKRTHRDESESDINLEGLDDL